MLGLAVLMSGLSMHNALVALRRPIFPLALAPAPGCTFDPVNLLVDELCSQLLKVFLVVELSLLATARLVEEEGTDKDHKEDGEKVNAHCSVPRTNAPVNVAHLADPIVAVDHPARVKVHF